MTPKETYQQLLREEKIFPDPAQEKTILSIERIYTQLNRPQWWRKLFNSPVKGLYCWGPVGVGKTFLMDLLSNTLTVKKKRMHFYLFMQYIHAQLQAIQGVKNPLEKIAKQIAKECQILMFDEFYVKNIADAMILGGLLKALFKNNVCFFATSNTAPDDLYKEGLQRESFIPAILEIKKHCEIHHLEAKQDYRFKDLIEKGVFFNPDDEHSEKQLNLIFHLLAKTHRVSHEPITLFDRTIHIRKRTSDTLWIDFLELCNIPRSEKDYAALAKKYSPIIVSHIPKIQPHQHALITNFIQLIDVLYDQKIQAFFSAEVPTDEIYTQGRFVDEFQRTRSRLNEMQTEAYLTHSARQRS